MRTFRVASSQFCFVDWNRNDISMPFIRNNTGMLLKPLRILLQLPITSSEYDMPEPELLVAEETDVLVPGRVILYNDEVHTFDEVIIQLIKATGCSMTEAQRLAFEVDSQGLACVFEGKIDECLKVSSILEEIALNTSIEFS